MFMTGLAGIGIALLAGIGIRSAAASAALLLVMMWTAVLPPENNPFMDDHLINAGKSARQAGGVRCCSADRLPCDRQGATPELTTEINTMAAGGHHPHPRSRGTPLLPRPASESVQQRWPSRTHR